METTQQNAPPAATSPPAPPAVAPAPAAPATIPTAGLIGAMVRSAKHVSDLIFSPGRPPQMEVDGQLVAVMIEGLPVITAEHSAMIAGDLMGSNLQASKKLREEGAADLSYSLAKVGRFRVNVFTQRGSCAIVMRVIP